MFICGGSFWKSETVMFGSQYVTQETTSSTVRANSCTLVCRNERSMDTTFDLLFAPIISGCWVRFKDEQTCR
jgi:hypothetical protein